MICLLALLLLSWIVLGVLGGSLFFWHFQIDFHLSDLGSCIMFGPFAFVVALILVGLSVAKKGR